LLGHSNDIADEVFKWMIKLDLVLEFVDILALLNINHEVIEAIDNACSCHETVAEERHFNFMHKIWVDL
jgi:hypothetical protein